MLAEEGAADEEEQEDYDQEDSDDESCDADADEGVQGQKTYEQKREIETARRRHFELHADT